MVVKRFRKKPVIIEAIQYTPHSNCGEVAKFIGLESEAACFDCANPSVPDGFIIPTLEGDMEASPGDWIIKGIAGEFYPCKPDIFEASYEEVSDV